jgi:hypothetical protein
MSGGTKGYLAGFAVAAAAIMALGWWVFDGSTTRPRILRSRLTLVVETPEGERSGSSVSQDTTSFPNGLTRGQGYGILDKLVGEAVVVDLGPRGLLFTTFETKRDLARGGMDNYNAGLAPFPQEKFRGKYQKDMSTNDEYAAYLDELNRLKPRGELAPKYLPVLVRFRDPNDPTSAELVDPLDLAASFGPGVTFKHALVEITDDPVTKGIEARLPWLASSKVSPPLSPQDLTKGRRLMSEMPLVEHLRYDDFRRLPR